MIPRMPDYHIHTALCKHARGGMEEYVERAIEIGLDEIGFADHMPVMPEPQFCMGWNDLPVYLARVRELRERYRDQISIRLGCEMDIVPGREDEIRNIISESGFDYVIGSLHYLDGWPFDQQEYRHIFERGDLKGIYDLFFNSIIRAAKTGLYDIAGHIDNIKRMGYRLTGDMSEYYERTAETLREMDLTVEVNVAGLESDAGEAYPSAEFLRTLNRYGVSATLGSDSHLPEEVGRHFGHAYRILREAGYDKIAYFSGRKRILKPLPVSAEGEEAI